MPKHLLPPQGLIFYLTRDLYRKGSPWEDNFKITISEPSLAALKNFKLFENHFLPLPIRSKEPARLIFTDVKRHQSLGLRSWGVWIPSLQIAAQGNFKRDEDIQILELKAIKKAVYLFSDPAPFIIASDNCSAIAYLNHRWKLKENTRMRMIALKIYGALCVRKMCLIRAIFLPGQLNSCADYLSRTLPYSSQELSQLWDLMRKNLTCGFTSKGRQRKPLCINS